MTTRPAIAPLHPEAQHLLERLQQWGMARLSEVGVAQARAASRAFTALQGPAEPVGEAYDVVVPGPAGGICARVYRSAGHESSSVLFYLHGGGWVIGDLAVVDAPCRALANATRCVVVSVEYRLSPETRFPGAAPASERRVCVGPRSVRAMKGGARAGVDVPPHAASGTP